MKLTVRFRKGLKGMSSDADVDAALEQADFLLRFRVSGFESAKP